MYINIFKSGIATTCTYPATTPFQMTWNNHGSHAITRLRKIKKYFETKWSLFGIILTKVRNSFETKCSQSGTHGKTTHGKMIHGKTVQRITVETMEDHVFHILSSQGLMVEKKNTQTTRIESWIRHRNAQEMDKKTRTRQESRMQSVCIRTQKNNTRTKARMETRNIYM